MFVCLLLAFFLMFLFFSILLFLKEKELKVGGGQRGGEKLEGIGEGKHGQNRLRKFCNKNF